MKTLIPLLLLAFSLAASSLAEPTNLVTNGSFELSRQKSGVPDDWAFAGDDAVKQHLSLDAGRTGGHCAKLVCTSFEDGGSSSHVMLCQVGHVSVRRGQWYRLTFWAKAEALKAGSVEAALVDTHGWRSSGLGDAFTPQEKWQPFEMLFQAKTDVPAATSRLQFWFKSTGTLWMDDVVLSPSKEGQQWFPQISTDGVKNFLPNSSFECGRANWGSFTYGLSGWAGNLYRLEGAVEKAPSPHGAHCLKIALTPDTLPVFYFDYYEPVRQPVRRVLVANRGWCHVQPGEELTLSAYLKADAEGVVAQLAANQAPSRLSRKAVKVGTPWRRYEYTFVPTQPFVFIAVGLDLDESKRAAATLWVDAIQLEHGGHASAYEPCQPVETFIETGALGNVFTNAGRGASFTVRGFNNTDREQTVQGEFTVTDFFDQKVMEKPTALKIPASSSANLALQDIQPGRRGFFRADWATSSSSQSLRCAIIDPVAASATDSPFGFNHAYPWDFLVQLAREAGIVWWRDWSAKWQTVEPEKGRFDFTVPDVQIERVLQQHSEAEVLLPFPSTLWSTTARPEGVKKTAGGDSYLQTRLPVAYAPKHLSDFGHYAAEVVRHYRSSRPRPVTHFQILNEPVYTSYALPRQFGYSLKDYLELLQTAYRAIKNTDPQCQVVGGISANLNAALTRDFVAEGGLQFVDVFDMHLYDPARPAENFEDSFRSLEKLMLAHGGPKPVWITEWGCYADDDPPCVPSTVGDAAMNRCRWPSERAATEHIVKFAAVAFAHGVRKIFFHAGTCGPINGSDAGGVLFEYGGAPRRMYAGVAAFTKLLDVPQRCLKILDQDKVHARIFQSHDRVVAIAWCGGDQPKRLNLARDVTAYDVMGNRLPAGQLEVGESPVYLIGSTLESVAQGF